MTEKPNSKRRDSHRHSEHLCYREGGYNRLHRDLYGELAFPFQATFPYRSGFVARRSAEDLAQLRRLEAIVRENALGRSG